MPLVYPSPCSNEEGKWVCLKKERVCLSRPFCAAAGKVLKDSLQSRDTLILDGRLPSPPPLRPLSARGLSLPAFVCWFLRLLHVHRLPDELRCFHSGCSDLVKIIVCLQNPLWQPCWMSILFTHAPVLPFGLSGGCAVALSATRALPKLPVLRPSQVTG